MHIRTARYGRIAPYAVAQMIISAPCIPQSRRPPIGRRFGAAAAGTIDYFSSLPKRHNASDRLRTTGGDPNVYFRFCKTQFASASKPAALPRASGQFRRSFSLLRSLLAPSAQITSQSIMSTGIDITQSKVFINVAAAAVSRSPP